ncbi:SAM and HD domain containing deoxynucleoside triphosphate triphosphohydrolase falten isoform X2 [Lycorma delicatula]|uniref:SAM and HD domain containing deoxynucleoside triphosphate triphosphohydrolase falten isoform X2 n=1 Tax=Lycorma delicatula TaxID=130591 RepID=UPI003F51A13A
MEVDKVFNDCVHGHIRLHPLCVKIIDTPEFQRLRNIKQLGTTYLVYPGACNNRFEHSLGVCYLAGRMVNALRDNTKSLIRSYSTSSNKDLCAKSDDIITQEEELCVKIAGLCHDIGHGPFSHLWGQILYECGVKWEHEKGSVDLFDYLIVKNNLIKDFKHYGIGEREFKLIKELIMGEGDTLPNEKRFLYQIVANKDNDIDVDKWDYFLRDGLQLNIKITFDYRRLLEFCCVVNNVSNDNQVIGYRDKEETNLFDMFRVRDDLHRRAYQHRVVKNFDLMYIDAFVEANKVYKFSVGDKVFKLSETQEDMSAFSTLTDHIFFTLLNDTNPDLHKTKTLLTRILKRELYTYIGTYHVKIQQNISVHALKAKLLSEYEMKYSPHVLRFCVIKLDFFHHISSSLNKVVLFKKRDCSAPLETKNIDVRSLADPIPLQIPDTSSANFTIHAYCQTYRLDEVTKKEIYQEINKYLKKMINHYTEKGFHNNCCDRSAAL